MIGALAILGMFSAGCYVDEYGVRGTRYMLKEMARARADGSLACALVFTRRSTASPFDVACRYEPESKTCNCMVRGADRFSEDIRTGLYPAMHSFRIDPCREWLPNGLEFPLAPSLKAALRDIGNAAKELGLELPQELRQ